MYRQTGIRAFLKDVDFKLIVLVAVLNTLGVLAVGSAKASYQNRAMLGMLAGFVVMILVSFINYRYLIKPYWFYYVINVVLLGLIYSPLGDSSNNSQRWLDLKFIRFQPSEIAKIVLILFFAQFIMKRKERFNRFGTIMACVGLVALPLVLIIKQPDLSTTIMLTVVFCAVMFIGGLSWKVVVGVIAVAVPTAVIGLMLVLQPDQQIIESYQQLRILAWLYPEEYEDSAAWQQVNSKIAIGSGQLTGKGYNNNEVSSVKNGHYISEPQTDFIFAVIGEEWGFLGSILILVLEFLVALECALIGWKARDLAGHIICGGMSALIGFQSFLNMGVATGLLPTTGVTLPFVSYGLTSLLTLYAGLGICLNVYFVNRRTASDITDDIF